MLLTLKGPCRDGALVRVRMPGSTSAGHVDLMAIYGTYFPDGQ